MTRLVVVPLAFLASLLQASDLVTLLQVVALFQAVLDHLKISFHGQQFDPI